MGRKKQESGVARVTGILVVVAALAWSCGTATGASNPDAAADSPPPVAAVAPTPAPFAPSGTVAQVVTPANVTLTDGRRIHVPMMNGILPWKDAYRDDCERKADLRVARKLLAGKQVQLGAPPRSEDIEDLVPAGHRQADVRVGGRDYVDAFTQQAYDAREPCRPVYPAPESSTTSTDAGSYSGDVDSSVGDGNARDGALTGGYCSRKRWC